MSASNGWAPLVPLGDVLKQARNGVSVRADAEYPNFGIYSYGRGLFHKEPISGSSTSASTLHQARAGQFVYSRLFAFEGAYGYVSPEYDGAFVSNEFPLFDCDENRLDTNYLTWLFRRPATWSEAAMLTTGMGNRRQRIKPEALYTYRIPLPPLSEQRRIVAKIERLAGKIAEARCLAESAAEARHRLAIAMALRGDLSDGAKHSAGWQKLPLGEIMQLALSPVLVDPTEQYANIGILSYGKGVFLKPPIPGSSTSASKLYKVKSGQFIYSRLFAFEGAYATVPEEADGTFVSNEFPTFDLDPRLALPELLSAYFSSPSTWSALISSSKGMGSRRQRIHPDSILDHEVWIPPMSWQEKIAAVSDRNHTAKSAEARVSKYSEALLPSILDRAFRGQL